MSDSKSAPTYNLYPAVPDHVGDTTPLTHDIRDSPVQQSTHGVVDTPPPYDGPSGSGPSMPNTHPYPQTYGTYGKVHVEDRGSPAIVILPAPIPAERLKDQSAVVVCPHCRQCVLTETETHSGMFFSSFDAVCMNPSYRILLPDTSTIPCIPINTGSATWLSALGLFILGATAWGCCLVPFCIPGLKDVVHVCTNCRHAIARYSRLNKRAVVFDY
ncbi:hypothetical protein BC938DRAFT_473220 [Jimgerdemannia flammicorona]|uniref:LITAF domain-containing protein n=1 Tax=Jimgerdemannia flammicorona TaxID=994334 RepID=A0A433Q4E5_9FUNG|nr:hypothetical protein BC938DRAFT_473220 [Jimgerdemannia flammicorona]